jgi:hypothetical protein
MKLVIHSKILTSEIFIIKRSDPDSYQDKEIQI